MHFNPPPSWPVQPGWTPPAGWVPDPSWPPAPPGWQFWSEEAAPRLKRIRGRMLLISGAMTTVIALVLAGIFLINLGNSDAREPQTAAGIGEASSIPLGTYPQSVAVDPVSGMLYVTTGDEILVVDPQDEIIAARIGVPNGASGAIAIDPPSNTLWAEYGICLDDGRYDAECRVISVVDTRTNTVVDTVNVQDPVKAIAADPDRRRILVATGPTDYGEPDTLIAIDADSRRELTAVNLTFSAERICVDPGAGRAIVSGLRGTTMFDTEDLDEIDLGLRPDSNKVIAAVDSSSSRALVAWSTTLVFIDTATGIVGERHPFSVGVGSNELAIDPMGYLIFSDSENSEVRVFDAKATSTGALIKVGQQPISLAVDPVSGTVYTADNAGQSLSIVPRE